MSRATIAFGLAIALLLGVAIAPAAAAGRQTTGDRISILDDDGSTYPANTAFFVEHGFGLIPRDTEAIGNYSFALDIDGTPQSVSFPAFGKEGDFAIRLFVFNVPSGLAPGDHVFTGHWFEPCGPTSDVDCAGAAPNTVMEAFTVEATVTFN